MIQNKTKREYTLFWSVCIYHFRDPTKTLTQSSPYACRSFLSSEKHTLSRLRKDVLFVFVYAVITGRTIRSVRSILSALRCTLARLQFPVPWLYFSVAARSVPGSLLAVAVAVPVPLLPALRLLLPLQEQPFAACFLPTLLSAPGRRSFYIPCNTFGWCMHTSPYYKHRQWQRHTADSVLFLWIFFYILL